MEVRRSGLWAPDFLAVVARLQRESAYRVFQKFVPIVNCILRKAFNASLGKCKLIQVRNLSK